MIKYILKLALLAVFFLAGCNSNPTYTASSQTPGVMILQDNLKGLKHYIRNMPDMNKTEDGYSLLDKAAMFDRPKSAELILSMGANVNNKGLLGMTPLFYTNSIAMLNVLTRYHVNIHALSALTGLNALSQITDTATIEALIKLGVDPAFESASGQSALSLTYGQVRLYKKLSADSTTQANKKAFQTYVDTAKEKIKTLQKYTSLTPAPEIISQARKGNLSAVQQQAKTINVITTTDASGNTALHAAATNNQLAVVKYLAKTAALLNVKNKLGFTALDIVAASKSQSARYLSCKMNKLCQSPKTFSAQLNKACAKPASLKSCERLISSDTHGVFVSLNLITRAKNIRFDAACKKFNYLKCKQLQQPSNDRIYAQKIDAAIQLHTPAIGKKYTSSCGAKGKKIKCLAFIKTYPGFKTKKETDSALSFLNQKCRIKETGWIYKSKQCKAGYAHGNGEAIQHNKQLSYRGQFANGQRTKGKVFYNNTPMYDGTMKNGKPNGVGVCFHEGEPEECKYYAGKRIDGLFKQRIEMAKQQKMMDEKLAQMQQAQNKQLQQMQTRMSQQPARGAKAKTMGDVIIDKAMDKAMSKVFDSLF